MPDTPHQNNYAAAPGMKDILPEDIGVFRAIEDSARATFERYGYHEIRTPLLEQTELFARGIGEVTDIVEKEMFTLKDEGLTLRPEGTAAVVRAYVEHSMDRGKTFRKFFYIGPFFRKERPQKGRLRQFHQVGLEAIGADDPLLDAEVITAACTFLNELGLEDWQLHLNSIGCSECRDTYRAALKESLTDKMEDLCENCQNRFDRNIFRILDCKEENCKKVAAKTPSFRSKLCPSCAQHLQQVSQALDSASVPYRFDDHLVRGFDYYTRTVFEITHRSLGRSQNAVAAGGRYDGLVEELGGPAVPGVGFSAGCERIALLMKDADLSSAPPALYVVCVKPEQKDSAFSLLVDLRAKGIACDMNYEGKSLKAQMRAAERSRARFTGILGPDEVEKGVVKLKNMETGEEQEVPSSGIADLL